MPKKPKRSRKKTSSGPVPALVVSVGCPCGIGPEVAVAAAARHRGGPVVLLGDREALFEAAEVRGVSTARWRELRPERPPKVGVCWVQVGPPLARAERRPGKPGAAAGRAQLAYVRAGYELTRRLGRRAALVTGPVSKEVVASSGAADARGFLGHTEYLGKLDRARSTVMCFASERLVTSLVTTHLPLGRVPRALTRSGVATATLALFDLLAGLGKSRPRIAVCSLNPHAGEGELLGSEERVAIVPGIAEARRRLGRRAVLLGPVGAETAYRKAHGGQFDGVVAMYHDQATIPMKLVAFSTAVNVTMGLSIVRTSVDHGTGYDIAGQGIADPGGMSAALELGARLASGRS